MKSMIFVACILAIFVFYVSFRVLNPRLRLMLGERSRIPTVIVVRSPKVQVEQDSIVGWALPTLQLGFYK
jgi:hypothetical protein